MAKERIGKLERWILIHCYLKTVKGELPPSWDLSRMDNEFYMKALWKYDVLNHYFNLEHSDKIEGYTGPKFKDTKKYRAALVSWSRAIRSLIKKGLVQRPDKTTLLDLFHNPWGLTKKGREKAEKYLNVNSQDAELTINNKKTNPQA